VCLELGFRERQVDPNLPGISVRYEVSKSDLFSDSEVSAQVLQRNLRRAQARRRAKA
jgi:hypothetical protein